MQQVWHWVRFTAGLAATLPIAWLAISGEMKVGLEGGAAIAASPNCPGTGGTYKNDRGDIATVTAASFGASNESQVNLYFKQQNYRKVLTFSYFTPNGYGIRSTNSGRSIYYTKLGTWSVAMFGEGSPLWYAEPRVGVPDSLWFQVSCQVNLEAAKRLTIPELANSVTATPISTRPSLPHLTYEFSEVVAPGPGSAQVRSYTIQLRKVGNNYTADIDIHGFQTSQRLHAAVDNKRRNNRTAFYFLLYREGNVGKPYQPGDLLFELEHLPDGRTKIIFGKVRSLYFDREEHIFGDSQI